MSSSPETPASNIPRPTRWIPLKWLFLAAFIISTSGTAFMFHFATKNRRNGGDFTLEDARGPWTFSDHKKDVSLLYFGYTQCPDVCPITLATLSRAYGTLTPEEKSRTQVIFVSVDHAHDQGADVDRYAKQFQPDFVGLTGPKEAVDRTIDLFAGSYVVQKSEKSELGYTIAHPDRIQFLNSRGKITRQLPGRVTPEDLAKEWKDAL